MEKREILGLVEPVIILGKQGQEKVLARIDTGATSSSLDINLAQKLGLTSTHTKIIKSAAGIARRPIAQVKVEMGGVLIDGEFSLADRKHMTYIILIGQNILKQGRFLIDPLKEVKGKA